MWSKFKKLSEIGDETDILLGVVIFPVLVVATFAVQPSLVWLFFISKMAVWGMLLLPVLFLLSIAISISIRALIRVLINKLL